MRTCTKIIKGIHEGDYVLRIFDLSSVSPLLNDGFTATDEEFKHSISGTTWKREFQHLHSDDDWLNQEDTIKGMVNHINGGWEYYGNAEPSPWVSTTANFEWAIWEIVRRLDKDMTKSVKLSVINRYDCYSSYYHGVKAIHTNASEIIQAFLERPYNYGMYDHERALKFSKTASEVLFYGKIFRKDIVETTRWNRYRKPLWLPKEFILPYHEKERNCTWIESLVWDPSDSFSEAKAKIQERRNQL
ncbi:hypothetical protein M231_03102 [Tremella mesenterica]|uniref:DUF7587 domain-containing protein n=1 Tax=Tremella mesenterica TaxID=5217 RepID=A0A4Q1BP81_TREME|nr:hypothetical protein M231_03102 [Tremella mesenterica]